MKKNIIFSLYLFLGFAFVSCDEDSQDQSIITYFINLEMIGDQQFMLPVGEAYVEPGVIATEGDEDVTFSIVTTGTVDSNSVGVYTITYSAVNKDGFSSSTTRAVIVYNPNITTDISGVYTTANGTYRDYNNGTITAFPGYTVTITYLGPGVFYASDLFAGYYDQRAGYGSTYAMTSYLLVNDDDSITPKNAYVAGWGDSYNRFKAVYNSSTESLSWELDYAGTMTFYVILTK